MSKPSTERAFLLPDCFVLFVSPLSAVPYVYHLPQFLPCGTQLIKRHHVSRHSSQPSGLSSSAMVIVIMIRSEMEIRAVTGPGFSGYQEKGLLDLVDKR